MDYERSLREFLQLACQLTYSHKLLDKRSFANAALTGDQDVKLGRF